MPDGVTGGKAGIQPHHAARLIRQLAQLDLVKTSADMNVPGWGLHALAGNLAGRYATPVCGISEREDMTWAAGIIRRIQAKGEGGYLACLGLNVTQAAAQLGVTRAALSRVLNGRAAISPRKWPSD